MRTALWYAVYGAMIAAQVAVIRAREGRAVDDEEMDGLHEEAATIATMAQEAAWRDDVRVASSE